MARVFGSITVSANAVAFQTKGDFEITVGGEVLTSIVGKDGRRHGSSVEHVSGSIEGTITASEDLDVNALFNLRNADVQVDFEGFSWQVVCSDADFTGPRTFNTAEGEIPVKFDGDITVLR